MSASSKTKNLICFFAGAVIPISTFFLYEYFASHLPDAKHFSEQSAAISTNTSNQKIATGNTGGSQDECTLPKLNPFDPSVLEHTKHIPAKLICETKEHPLIFKTDLDSNLIVVNCPFQYSLESCCYKKMIPRPDYVDGDPGYSEKCTYLTNTTTKIPDDHETIAIFCKNTPKPLPPALNTPKNTTTTIKPEQLKIIDILGFTRLKPDVEKRIGNDKNSNDFSVIVLAIDSISHMNFIRTMPKTYKYITEELKGAGMNGYVSVGTNSRPNVFPALVGQTEMEMTSGCAKNKYNVNSTTWTNEESSFDKCPMVWKNFSSQGFRTSYVEDSIKFTAFKYGATGFYAPPADYYFLPRINAARVSIGHKSGGIAYMCNGPRIVLDILLNQMMDFATVMGKRKYFQWVWSSAITHDDFNNPKMIDDNVLSALQQMKLRGHLDNKVFIFMSDHGYRWGDFRDTYQGALEARMPFLYVVLPEAFVKRYPTMAANLKVNTNRLTSPFDIHATLLHLSTLSSADNEDNNRRFYTRWMQSTKQNVTTPPPGRGISLLAPIPSNRTCKSAGVPEHFCICHKATRIPTNETGVLQAAEAFVSYINNRLKNLTICSKLALANVSEVFRLQNSAGSKEPTKGNEMLIRFFVEIVPGNGKFEVTMSRNNNSVWTRLSDSRINSYKNTSHCVSDQKIKNYCFCLK